MNMNRPVQPNPPIPEPGPRENDGYGSYGGYGYPDQRSNDFSRIAHALIEKAWIVALCVAVLLGVGYVYVSRATVLYSATATVQVEQDDPNFLKMATVSTKDLQAADYLQTVAQSLVSRPMLEKVAETNQLWTDPRFLTGAAGTTNRNRILSALEKLAQAKLRRGTRLIDITVTHRVPELTKRIADSIVDAFLHARAERVDDTLERANGSLAKEAERLRKKLTESENALQAYKEKVKTSSLDEKQNTVVAKLQELSTKATEAKAMRIKIETDVANVSKLGENIEALINVPSIATDPTVVALQTSLIKAEDDLTVLGKRYLPKHPKFSQAKSQVHELKIDVTNAVFNAVKTLRGSLNTAKAAEKGIEEAMKAQEAAALELGRLSIEYSVLAREVESDRMLYGVVIKGMKESWVEKETQQTAIIRLVEPAELPEEPVWPKKQAILAMCGLAGAFLGVFIVIGLRVADTSIRTVDEVEASLGLSVFSVVPNMRDLKPGHSRLVVTERAGSEVAEAFRTLRTSMSTLGDAGERRVSLFTSATPSEGKTFCSINYAASLAQLGLKTLLVDADLRLPAVESTLLGSATDSAGLAEYLSGKMTLLEVVRSTKVEHLSFISAGSTAAAPAELLAKNGLNSLIPEALKHYDRIVIDSAPVNAVSDTLLIVKGVQTVCLVVRVGFASRRHLLHCVQLLQGANAALAGVVLNRMPRRRFSAYGAYYDYQHHGKYGKEGVYGKS